MIIYKITNKTNGKVYIGQTVRTLPQRWKHHCYDAEKYKDNSVFHKAIRKYGADNFAVEQIDVACSKEELNAKEVYWIEYYKCGIPNGYNMTHGGEGCRTTDATRRKQSASHIGKKHEYRSICIVNVDTKEIFSSVYEAANKYNLNHSYFCEKLKKSRCFKYGGFEWFKIG